MSATSDEQGTIQGLARELDEARQDGGYFVIQGTANKQLICIFNIAQDGVSFRLSLTRFNQP